MKDPRGPIRTITEVENRGTESRGVVDSEHIANGHGDAEGMSHIRRLPVLADLLGVAACSHGRRSLPGRSKRRGALFA